MENSRSLRRWNSVLRSLRYAMSLLVVVALLAPDSALAARRYWVGAYGTEVFSDILNWSETEGGFGGASVPGASDVAIFHSTNSGNNVTFKEDINVAGIILTNAYTGVVRTGTSNVILGQTGARIGSGYFIIQTGTKLSSSGTWTQTGGVVYNVRANHQFRISGSLIVMGRARFRYSGTILFNGKIDQRLAFSGSYLSSAPSAQAVGRHSFSGLTLASVGTSTTDNLIISGSYLRVRNLTINNGTVDLRSEDVPLALTSSGNITIADDADASLDTDQNITLSGSLTTGASGRFFMSGGTLKMNGIRQNLDVTGIGSQIHTLNIDSSSGAYLTGLALVAASLTVNSSRVLTFAANTLYLTGGTITNNGTIRENTGKLVHTGATFFITNSDFDAQDTEVKTAETMYFTLTECDENIDGAALDTLTITVSITSGDSETVTLTETAVASCIFRGNIVTENAAATTGDSKLQATAEKVVTATFTDAQDSLSNSDTTLLTPIGTTTSSNTNSGGGSSRSRGGGGGGGGKISVPVTPRVPEPKNVPKKNMQRLTAKQRMEARKAARIAAMKRMNDRKAARLNKMKRR